MTNFLFHTSEDSNEANAVIYSMVKNCQSKHSNIVPYRYMVLPQMPNDMNLSAGTVQLMPPLINL